MPKRISYIVLIMTLVLLGFFISKKYTSSSQSKHVQSVPTASSKIQQKTKVKKATSQRGQQSLSTKLSTFLIDSKFEVEDKVYKVRDLNLNPTITIGKKNIKELVTFINSENPYAHDPQAYEPHSAKAYKLQREASLRVYSIKRLSQSLPLPELDIQIQNIIRESNDPTIVKIAKQVLKAKQNGKDYFQNMKQGLRNMSGPNHQQGEDTSHSHH